MLGFLERHRLIKKGLASGKVRRRQSENELTQALEAAILPKCFIFAGFIAGLALIIFSSADSQPAKSFLIGLLITATAIAYLWISHPKTFAKNSRVLLIFGVFLVHLTLLKAALFLSGRVLHDLQFGELLVPFAFAPLICSVLLGRELGLYSAIFASLWGWDVLHDIVETPDAFLFMSLICGFIAVYVTLQVRRRSRLIRAGVFVGLATWILALLFQIIPIVWEQFPTLDWTTIAKYSLVAIAGGIFTSMLVGGSLPLLESLFEITTDISWLELADLNHPLLKRMTIEAPGTYHHSLVVANLAEAAAEAVGANPTMCRVGAYFHDIGKLVKPEYFTENMSPDRDPHLELAPTMSALIIIAHVKEGVDLALKYKLNQEIIDVIQQHHGTTLVWFFYKRALQQQEDARQGGKIMNIREEDIPEVRDESFRYPGPRPQSRECGIISLADAIESASRSLEKVTPQRIDQLINDIIEKRLEEHQLDECDLTLREIKLLGDSFKFTLRSMLHSRIAYPGDSSKDAKDAPATKTPQRESGIPPVSAA
ncbi:MAG TPA: HDIG domain-containing protein [Chthoniobacteraceae bacterium]|nr:HDIG domain-containing protein [Chthoniobacteraceae bacterium]